MQEKGRKDQNYFRKGKENNRKEGSMEKWKKKENRVPEKEENKKGMEKGKVRKKMRRKGEMDEGNVTEWRRRDAWYIRYRMLNRHAGNRMLRRKGRLKRRFLDVVRTPRLRWLGHVGGTDAGNMGNRKLRMELSGKRKRGIKIKEGDY